MGARCGVGERQTTSFLGRLRLTRPVRRGTARGLRAGSRKWSRAGTTAELALALSALAATLLVVAPSWASPASVALATPEPPFQELARELVGADQPVFVITEGSVILASLNADRPVHPASVSKVASTLALLKLLGPDYRIETRFLGGGPLEDGTVDGDLIVVPGGDPFLINEGAVLILDGLHERGVRAFGGGLTVRGNLELMFNWRPDPQGVRLRRALVGVIDAAAWQGAQRARRGSSGAWLDEITLRFNTRPRKRSSEGTIQNAIPLVVYKSPPLRRMLKELNGYSNNIFHPFSQIIGGPKVVERIAREQMPPGFGPEEMVIDNAAGAGRTNRMSARAVVALFSALATELGKHRMKLVDVLPVSGMDKGTLESRLDDPDLKGAVAGKTGTYPSVGASALAGVANTRKYGAVAFAILNRGVPVPEARKRQNAFVAALLRDAGPKPWPYTPTTGPAFAEAVVEQAH